MKTTQRTNIYYEIKSPCDHYGLCGTFETEDDALAEINSSYIRALERGFDNRNEKWSIICVKTVRTFIDNGEIYGEFYKEETIRTRVATAEFDEYTNAFTLSH